MVDSGKVNSRVLRDALGHYPTGVTVVTAPDVEEDRYVGVTVNSFSSVSLDPPLILWSLDREAQCRSAFERSGHFAVNMLSSEQRLIASHFARKQADKFDGLEVTTGAAGAPLLDSCVARFQCRTEQMLDGGDHLIFVGTVIDFDTDPEREPLVLYRGGYANVQLEDTSSDNR